MESWKEAKIRQVKWIATYYTNDDSNKFHRETGKHMNKQHYTLTYMWQACHCHWDLWSIGLKSAVPSL